jgi:hypothetical protein
MMLRWLVICLVMRWAYVPRAPGQWRDAVLSWLRVLLGL